MAKKAAKIKRGSKFEAVAVATVLVLLFFSAYVYSTQTEPLTVAEPKKFVVTESSGGINFNIFKPLSYSTCTPDAGYTECIQNTYYYGDAKAYAKIQVSDITGIRDGYGKIEGATAHYYIGEAGINVKKTGDKLYVLKGQTSFGDPCCEFGCTGTKISDGRYIIAKAPKKNPPFIYFISWDYASSGGYWCWTAAYYGWVGNPPYYNFYVLNCYEDSDCGDGLYCDRSGTWDTWSCKIDPCTTMAPPENICDGYDLYSQTCEHGEYLKGQLIEKNSATCGYDPCDFMAPPENICEGYNLYSQKCDQGSYYKDALIEANSAACGYDPCDFMAPPSDKCYGLDLWSRKCSNGEYVQDQLIEDNSTQCGYVPKGSITVETVPENCSVFANGVYLGQSPVTSELRADSYLVGIIQDGYISQNQTLELMDRQTKTLNFTLEPEPEPAFSLLAWISELISKFISGIAGIVGIGGA